MAVEGERVELRQDEYVIDAAVDAIAHRDIYEPVTPSYWNLRV